MVFSKRQLRLFGVVVGFCCFSVSSWAMDIQQFLHEFHQDPRSVMDRLPEVRDGRARKIRLASVLTTEQRVQLESLMDERDRVRMGMYAVREGVQIPVPQRDEVGSGWGPQADYGMEDRAEDLVDLPASQMIRKLSAMPTRGELERKPWSDSYWPIYMGVLGQRYADSEFPFSMDWKTNFEGTHGARAASRLLDQEGNEAIKKLSPSEKYDLLVGGRSGILTDAMWDAGEQYFSRTGRVEPWMGICHGWAVASYMLPRPQKTVEVLAADGVTRVFFRPSDIKGLASLLWAEASTPSKFVGGRCNDKNPPTDSNGRLTSPRCFDTNPGTWHLAVVNQISKAKKSFVMDATYDYEVWNQPVISYEYQFFNPETGDPVSTLSRATIRKVDYKKDKFSKYRSTRTEKIVGIAMTVTYGAESLPSGAATSSEEEDVIRMVDYVYDLELDAQGNIIGGEWYQNRHPDFLWTAAVERAESLGENDVTGVWNMRSKSLPLSWRNAASRAASVGQPLSLIVEKLIQASQ